MTDFMQKPAQKPMTQKHMTQKHMRRKDRQLTLADAEKILRSNRYGVLSTVGVDGQPYGVPLTYLYQNGHIYFHCAVEGRKLENLRACGKGSFCVVGETELLPGQFSTRYESVIAEGPVRELTGEDKIAVLTQFVEQLAPEFTEKGAAYIQAAQARARVFAMTTEQISGKARR